MVFSKISKLLKKRLLNFDSQIQDVVEKSISSIIVKIFATIFSFGLSILIGRTIGAEGLGIITLSNKIAFIVVGLALFGMNNVIIKEVAIAFYKNRIDRIGNVMNTAFWFNGIVTTFISTILIWLAPWFANIILKEPNLTYPLIIGFVVMTPQVFSRIFSSGLLGYKKIWQSNLVDDALGSFLTFILVLIIWLLNLELSVNIIASCYAISKITVTISVGLYWKKIHQTSFPIKIILKQLLKISKPLFLVSITTIIINNSDIIILSFFTNSSDIGVYSVAVRLSLLTSIMIHVTNSVLSPKIAALYSNNEIETLKLMIKKVTRALLFFGILVYSFYIFFGKYILSAWGEEFGNAYVLLLILSFGQLVNLSTGAVGAILTMTGLEKVMRNISISFMLVFLILIFLLTSKYGVIGTAISVSFTKIGINLTKLIYVSRLRGIKIY